MVEIKRLIKQIDTIRLLILVSLSRTVYPPFKKAPINRCCAVQKVIGSKLLIYFSKGFTVFFIWSENSPDEHFYNLHKHLISPALDLDLHYNTFDLFYGYYLYKNVQKSSVR